MENNMTEEQKRFVEECEIEFKDRFTENDIEFMKIKSASPKKPPIIDPWYTKPRRQPYFWDQQNQGHGSRNHNWDRGSLERDPWYNKPRKHSYDQNQQSSRHGSRNHNLDRRSFERGDRLDSNDGKHYAHYHNRKLY
ncbi:PREDICTED: RNMT-activating mini protein [Polistes canadensis]|uniref:RNMT-activating mini protein n=1 Tax=Polistes canadensis TaxID=91411 RepID=UPI000718F953|nr:PREDICTED: RNMT-activating mini protein [Polistes canadensis]